MNDFCVARIATDTLLRAEHGVWRAQALTLTRDARAAAAHILADAAQAAEHLRQRAAADARAAVQEAERQALERCALLLQQLEQRHAQVLDGAQVLAVDLALALFERALADTSARERIEASCRRLLQEAPRRLAEPVLYLHPDDSALAPCAPDWERRSDATLARGACRLEAGGGEWRADFAAGAAALGAAFDGAARHQDAMPDSPARPTAPSSPPPPSLETP
jgi:flagellar biosynthesis/type III secretory pathway protein FliH